MSEQDPYNRMINAAPEMLAVCRRILANCERGRSSRHQFADGKGSLAGCDMSLKDIEAARLAIAKATGEVVIVPK